MHIGMGPAHWVTTILCTKCGAKVVGITIPTEYSVDELILTRIHLIIYIILSELLCIITLHVTFRMLDLNYFRTIQSTKIYCMETYSPRRQFTKTVYYICFFPKASLSSLTTSDDLSIFQDQLEISKPLYPPLM